MPLEYATASEQQQTELIHARWIRAASDSPLVLMIHGRAGTAKVISAFTNTLPDSCNLLAPEATIPDLNGFSWWPVGQNNSLDLVQTASLKVLNFLESALKIYNLRPKSIYLLGFSQGAALSSVLIQMRPDLFSGLILLAGLTVPLPNSEKIELQGKEFFIAHGTNDDVIPIAAAQKSKEFFESRGGKVFYHEDPVEHKIGAAGMRQLKNWSKEVIS